MLLGAAAALLRPPRLRKGNRKGVRLSNPRCCTGGTGRCRGSGVVLSPGVPGVSKPAATSCSALQCPGPSSKCPGPVQGGGVAAGCGVAGCAAAAPHSGVAWPTAAGAGSSRVRARGSDSRRRGRAARALAGLPGDSSRTCCTQHIAMGAWLGCVGSCAEVHHRAGRTIQSRHFPVNGMSMAPPPLLAHHLFTYLVRNLGLRQRQERCERCRHRRGRGASSAAAARRCHPIRQALAGGGRLAGGAPQLRSKKLGCCWCCSHHNWQPSHACHRGCCQSGRGLLGQPLPQLLVAVLSPRVLEQLRRRWSALGSLGQRLRRVKQRG